MTDIGTIAMAHRYLYYVKASPIISDQDYDRLESAVRKVAPPDHPINSPGSDRDSDYSGEMKVLAMKLLAEKRA